MIYEPREDSYLIQKYLENYAKVDLVLDMGTGSGIQAGPAFGLLDQVHIAYQTSRRCA